MSDLISRQDTIEAIDKYIDTFDAIDTNYLCGLRTAMSFLKEMPSAQPEPLTDKEQRIFLAAMERERKVCKQVDEEWRDCREPYEDSLVQVCNEIERKVKGALWGGK